VLALQDIVGTAPGGPPSQFATFINNGVGGFAPANTKPVALEDARTIAAAGGTGRVCVGGNKAVGCYDMAANGDPTPINAVLTGFTSTCEAIIVDASGAWLLLPIVTQNLIQVYKIDPNSGTLTLASSVPAGGTPRGILLSPDNQNLIVVLSNTNTVSVRTFDAAAATDALPSSPAPTSYAVGINPSRIVFGAFTPSSYAVTNKGSNSLSLLPGTTSGPSGTATSYPVACSPSAIVTSDLDQDANTDILIGCSAAPPLIVLLNNGEGGFVASNP
jgi:Lactonase, 7-bladed beta-propeller